MRITQLCFGHMFPLMAALLLLLLSGVRCEELTALKTEVCAEEGSSVSLGFSYHKDISYGDTFLWYIQYPGKNPYGLLYHNGNGDTWENTIPKKLSVSITSRHVHLLLSPAAVADSAVYYCAVRPSSTTSKLHFGRGTTLTVHISDDPNPSFYPLETDDTKVCLATGFSRHNKLQNIEIFNKTSAAFIDQNSDDDGIKGLYSQVALMSDGEVDQCPESSGGLADDTLQPDPALNLLSLTVLGLRILFIKTVAFNVLLTLRLFISR